MKSVPIVLATSNFPPLSGGISRYLFQIMRFLPSDLVRVIALPTPGWQDFDEKQDFSIRRLRLPPNWSLSNDTNKYLAPFYFKELLRERDAEIVLCGQAYHSLILPSWLIQKLTGKPYGIFTYGLDLLRPQTRRYKWFFNKLLQSANIVFADSHAAASIGQNLGVKQHQIHVVHPTIESKELHSRITANEIRLRHGLDGKKCILSVGRLVERKGFDTVIRALPMILHEVPIAHYLIVGSGPLEDHLKSMVEELGLEEHVTFVGYVSDEELAAYYMASDVFAMISREIPDEGDLEGFGIVYLEANLLGKPVVAGRSGGVVDAVLHEQTGLLVNPICIEEIAQGIIRMLINPELAKMLGENGRERVLSEFNGRVAAKKVLDVLKDNISNLEVEPFHLQS